MKKRFVSMILVLILAILGLLPAVTAEDQESAGDPGYWYVNTENGKSLNVRDAPGGEIVGSLRNGSRVHVRVYTDENWAMITYKYTKEGFGEGTFPAWVNRRFLSRKKPETSASAKKTEQPAADPLEELNKEFKEAVKITPIKVTVRPSRASGWVNMHWAPSNSTEVIATYKANDTLLAIRELPNWYQVEDQDTGDVGFINKAFVTQ